MKKSTLIAALVVLLGLILVSPAFAVNVFTHGDFAANSRGCADCHITHGANAAKLLVAGPTQSDTCFFCHGEGSYASAYNAEYGYTMGTGTMAQDRVSFAGGFVYSGDPAYANWVNPIDGAAIKLNTSVHSVELAYQNATYPSSGQVIGKDIPGGQLGWTSAFRCGSCHDPHAGGKYPADTGYINPRLLRLKPIGVTTDRAVYMRINYDYSAGNTENKTRQTMEYGKGFNAWCGACHDRFNTEGAGAANRSGSNSVDNGLGANKYRHKMGVMLTSTGHTGFSTSLKDGLPLATSTTGSRDAATTDTKYLNCLTCHRAHGSSASVTIGYKRFRSYDTIYGSATDTIGTSLGASALLRLPERDVCFKCHGAAQYNRHSDGGTGNYGVGY